MNRCKQCGAVCPDFSELCDTCAFIQEEDGEYLWDEDDLDDEELEDEEEAV